MAKSTATLKQLLSRLHEQAEEMATVRATLDLQFKRIAQMQAELDLLPHAKARRQKQLAMLMVQVPSNNGNHRPQ
jgi:chaperonin cofactor prefoldin